MSSSNVINIQTSQNRIEAYGGDREGSNEDPSMDSVPRGVEYPRQQQDHNDFF